MRQVPAGDPHPGVPDPHHRVAVLAFDGEPDPAPGLRVLAGVLEQVAQHLLQPDAIALDVERLGGE